MSGLLYSDGPEIQPCVLVRTEHRHSCRDLGTDHSIGVCMHQIDMLMGGIDVILDLLGQGGSLGGIEGPLQLLVA